MPTPFRILLLVSMLIFSIISYAEPDRTKISIEKAINAFVEQHKTAEQQMKIEIATINGNLRLNSCAKPLEINTLNNPSLKGRLSFKVNCSSPRWGLYIPVHIRIYEPVVFSKQPLIKGGMITKDMLEERIIETTTLNSEYFTHITQAIGSIAKTPVPYGQIVTLHAVEEKLTIKKQEEVTIIANAQGIQIKTTGIALNSGQIGDYISVRNKSSNKLIEAQVLSEGLVRVNP